MFKRIVFEDSAAIFTIVAFVTAVAIFVTIAWRALRMSRAQESRFADLPFNSDSTDTHHDSSI
jgi:hypothetical protein